MDGIAGEITVVGAFLLFLDDVKGLGHGFFVFFLREHVHFQHAFQHFVALFQRRVRVEHRVVGGGAVADPYQDGGFINFQVRSVFSEIVAAGGLDAVALMAVKVGVAVKLHNIGLGVGLLDLRGKKDLHHLSGKGFFLGQVSVLDDLLGNGASPLGDGSPVFDKGKTRAGGGDPVNTVVDLKTAVLLGYVGILKIQADLGDVRVFIMACVDDADAFAVFIKYFRV